MPTFRQRPLTWLFWIATICLDVVALANDHEAAYPNAMAIGQLFVASGWLIVGRAHRLIRAGVLVATIWLLTMPDFLIPRLRGGQYADLVWPHIATIYITMATATAAWTWCWLMLARLTSWPALPAPVQKRQFPLAELFGWTIIVAVGSVGIQRADFSLLDGPKGIAITVGFAAVVGAVMALGLGAYGRGTAFRAILASGLLLVIVGSLVAGLRREELTVAAGALAFVGVWVIALRLDSQRLKSEENATVA